VGTTSSQPTTQVAYLLAAALILGTCGHTVSRAPVARRCAQIDRDNQQALAAFAQTSGKAVPEDFKRALHDAARCVETPHGAWGLAISSLTVDAASWIAGRWSLVYVDASGARFSVSPSSDHRMGADGEEPVTQDANLNLDEVGSLVPLAPVVFDYDGDGEPEAVVVVKMVDYDEDGGSPISFRGRIWTVHAGAIRLYPPARSFIVEEIRDVDGDGRPDIITHEPYADLATINCGSGDDYPVYGPALLVHSLPDGTFSLADAQAMLFAKQECAVKPSPVILIVQDFQPEMVDFPRSAKNVACARLWGADEQTLRAEIALRCYVLNENCVTCDNRALLDKWASMERPFRFPAADGR
jgi:hypothetical protein